MRFVALVPLDLVLITQLAFLWSFWSSSSSSKLNTMAYKVKFTIPTIQLGKADIDFEVQTEEGVLGVLKISKGALVWVPRGKKIGYKVRWGKFDEFAQTCKGRERRQPRRGGRRVKD